MNEALLERIVDTGSEIVILDITGVPVVDTAVAKHLLETVAAARLLGAEVLIVGLSTRTALTLVHLGLDLAGVTTRTTMAKGLELAFARLGLEVVRGARRRPHDRAARRSDALVARVPIIHIGDTLIATVQEDLRDRTRSTLQAATWRAAGADRRARGAARPLDRRDGRLLPGAAPAATSRSARGCSARRRSSSASSRRSRSPWSSWGWSCAASTPR